MAVSLKDISKHLTEEIIEKLFEFKTNDKKLKCVEVKRAAPAGEGLLGAVYRVIVTGQTKNTSFIVKGLVSDTLLRKSLDCPKYFKREVLFYSKILPVLIDLENELGAKHTIQNHVPVCYGCLQDGENDFIILEDLSESNCVALSGNPTRHQRDLCLSVLAHIHAVSMALRIKKPKEFSRIVNTLPEVYFNEDNREWYKRYLQSAIEIDKKIINEYEDCNSIYYKKFYEIVDNDPYSQFIEILSAHPENAAINHGDAWCPNFLCSEIRSVAVDFQIVRCASPAIDLAYFIILCGNHCKVKEDFSEAVNVYYNSFDFYLQDLGLDCNEVYSKEDLMSDFKKFGKFGLLASITSIPLLASRRCDVLQSFKDKYSAFEKIPLEYLWSLTPIDDEDAKMCLVNAVRVTVDVGLI